MKILLSAVLALGCVVSPVCMAARAPVLGQIDLPHPYYYREMYLPQLTGGPSSLAWAPDSATVIYSMAGSLWRQHLGSGLAEQLTAAVAYDYQPDCSPDGRWVVYSSYRGDALELWVLDLESGATHALTSNHAVNVEPRFSPDGKRIVFVSTLYNRRFHIFTAISMRARSENCGASRASTRAVCRVTTTVPTTTRSTRCGPRRPRDPLRLESRPHLRNRRVLADSCIGGARRARCRDAAAQEFHYEETNWKARPDVSPDGSRLVFSSYTGRSWHNLWLMPAGGGDAFRNCLWGLGSDQPALVARRTQIAFISNQSGSTEINVVGVPGGEVRPLVISERRYLNPKASLRLDLRDANGKRNRRASASPTWKAGSTRPMAPGFMPTTASTVPSGRSRRIIFMRAAAVDLDVPAGPIRVEILRGFERRFERRELTTVAGQTTNLTVNLDADRFAVPDAARWVSADVHVHMNYGGVYRNTPAHLATQAEAEDLGIVNALIVNKEQRFPDIAYNGRQLDPASRPDALMVHGQEYHTSYWGHLGCSISAARSFCRVMRAIRTRPPRASTR
jgi:TolB protein